MIKSKTDLVSAAVLPNISSDSIKIQAGSVVVDNVWINYNTTVYKVNDYIAQAVVSPRTRFFYDRNYAVVLLVCLDVNQGIVTVEGQHVPFTTLDAVPFPTSETAIPLMGVILIQDGTTDLIYGYKPLAAEYIKYFSGAGNILDRNIQGPTGLNASLIGETGLQGFTGVQGPTGMSGFPGYTGEKGAPPVVPRSETGLQGPTGIAWDIHIPFKNFSV